MTENDLNATKILELYKEQGSVRRLTAFLQGLGHTISAGSVQRLLKKADPNYSALRVKNEREAIREKSDPIKPLASGKVTRPDRDRRSLGGRKFVFTSAQNNTYLHEEFFASLLQFCAKQGAQLVVSPFTYNKNGFQNGTKENDSLWYDPRLEEYMIEESTQVCADLIFCGELDILPTAVNPFSGLESYTQSASGIFPHAKVQMLSLPRMKGEDPRFLYTTGAVTSINYIQRKAGQKAQFHHVYGALYVELDADGKFFARQLIADTSGEFYDLDKRYTPTEVVYGQRPACINWGDIHIEKQDDLVSDGAWGPNSSMLNTLQPKNQMIHDLTDFRARNHHNIDDPYFLAEMRRDRTSSVQEDIAQSADFLNWISRYGTMTYVVESNHDQAYKLWLKTADVRKDPENAEFFHKSNARMYEAIRTGDKDFNVFAWAVTTSVPIALHDVTFLNEDDSIVLAGIECGMHGHRGPNGARGSSKSFRAVGRKVNVGHSHSAGIIDGVYTAGVSASLDMGYNKGPSSWSHSHIVTYPNGKRAIITMRGNKWRG